MMNEYTATILLPNGIAVELPVVLDFKHHTMEQHEKGLHALAIKLGGSFLDLTRAEKT